jgi:hypothetical protein
VDHHHEVCRLTGGPKISSRELGVLGLDGVKHIAHDGQASVGTIGGLRLEAHGGAVAAASVGVLAVGAGRVLQPHTHTHTHRQYKQIIRMSTTLSLMKPLPHSLTPSLTHARRMAIGQAFTLSLMMAHLTSDLRASWLMGQPDMVKKLRCAVSRAASK